MKSRAWYLVARAAEKPRTYRVAHIRDVELLDSAVVRPAKFDLGTYWQASDERFEASLRRDTATVIVEASGLSRIVRREIARRADTVVALYCADIRKTPRRPVHRRRQSPA